MNNTQFEQPTPTQFDYGRIPHILRSHDRWLCFNFMVRDGKRTKVPVDLCTGWGADATNEAAWLPFRVAYAGMVAGKCDGVGFVLGDGFFGIDLDRCFMEGGWIHPAAAQLIEFLPTYWERSQSMLGMKCIGCGFLELGTYRNKRGQTVKKTGRKKSNAWEPDGALELYVGRRMFALTSDWLHGPADACELQTELDIVFAHWFPAAITPPAWRSTGGTGLDADDAEVIRRASSATNGARFQKLWTGDISAHGSRSEADLALASHLAFWIGPNFERIWAMCRQSGLHRDKWEREDYAAATIGKALEAGKFYKPREEAGSAFGYTAPSRGRSAFGGAL